MEYIPKDLSSNNVNITKDNPLKEMFKLLFSILLIISITYYLIGLAADYFVERMPKKVENYLATFLTESYTKSNDSDESKSDSNKIENKLQKLLNNLVLNMEGQKEESKIIYKLHLAENEMVNAIALPGNNIVVFSGLLDEIETENELSMILAHELGHFANRDHLRGLGRGLVLITISILLMGADSSISDFIANVALTTTESRFSQKQELAADTFGVKLLKNTYGHCAGATGFFERLAKKQNENRFMNFFASHPASMDRVKKIKEVIEQVGCEFGVEVEYN